MYRLTIVQMTSYFALMIIIIGNLMTSLVMYFRENLEMSPNTMWR